jgi:hypothetical protein
MFNAFRQSQILAEGDLATAKYAKYANKEFPFAYFAYFAVLSVFSIGMVRPKSNPIQPNPTKSM